MLTSVVVVVVVVVIITQFHHHRSRVRVRRSTLLVALCYSPLAADSLTHSLISSHSPPLSPTIAMATVTAAARLERCLVVGFCFVVSEFRLVIEYAVVEDSAKCF